MVIDESKIHSGGACSSNVIARNAIREGEIDKNFLCPHKGNGEKCLMRLLVEEKRNCSLHLYLKFEVEK